MKSNFEQLSQEVNLSLGISRLYEAHELIDEGLEENNTELLEYGHGQLEVAESILNEALLAVYGLTLEELLNCEEQTLIED